MSKLKKLCIAMACTVAVSFGSSDATAADIFNTTGSSNIATFNLPPPFYVSTLFHTTATDFIINSLSIQTNNTAGTRSGNIVVKVYSAGSNQPGSQVGANLGTYDASNLSTSISLTGINRTLSPSTNYWLVLDFNGVTGGPITFSFTTTPSGPASPFYFAQSSNSGATWSANSGVALIGVITAVPEPGTIILVVASVGVLSIAGYRRAKKTA